MQVNRRKANVPSGSVPVTQQYYINTDRPGPIPPVLVRSSPVFEAPFRSSTNTPEYTDEFFTNEECEKFRLAFDRLDTSGDGKISAKELKGALTILGYRANTISCKKIIKVVIV